MIETVETVPSSLLLINTLLKQGVNEKDASIITTDQVPGVCR